MTTVGTFSTRRSGAATVIRWTHLQHQTAPLSGRMVLTAAEMAAGHDRPLIAALRRGGYAEVQAAPNQ